jgi:hypothetical protein
LRRAPHHFVQEEPTLTDIMPGDGFAANPSKAYTGSLSAIHALTGCPSLDSLFNPRGIATFFGPAMLATDSFNSIDTAHAH